MDEDKINKITDLILFFIIAFIISWSLWIPQVLSSRGIMTMPKWYEYVSYLATFGPSISALIVISIRKGKQGLKDFFKNIWNFNFNKKWLIPVFVLIPILSAIAYAVTVLSFHDTWFDEFMWSTLVNFFIMFFVGGPLGEELGWRGFALNRLQERSNALMSSLILGIIWGFWHLPLHLISGSTQEWIPLWANLILMTVTSILYTWLFNNTKGNVLIAILFHWISNGSVMLIPYWQKGDIYNITTPNLWIPTMGMIIGFAIILVFTIVIIFMYGPEDLRGKKVITEI